MDCLFLVEFTFLLVGVFLLYQASNVPFCVLIITFPDIFLFAVAALI